MTKKYLNIGTYKPETDEAEEVDREYYGQGFIFKDEEAYEMSLDKICYVPELSDNKYTHQDFLDMCDGQETIAQEIFNQVDWQHPETLLDENYRNGECDDCPECGRMFFSYGKTECPYCHVPYNREET